jgi:hypothetical protein
MKDDVQEEKPTDINFWWKNGSCTLDRVSGYTNPTKAETELSIGRTNSKLALGFIVTRGDQCMDFVLDRKQVENLFEYLKIQIPRLKKGRAKRNDRLVLREMLGLGRNLGAGDEVGVG